MAQGMAQNYMGTSDPNRGKQKRRQTLEGWRSEGTFLLPVSATERGEESIVNEISVVAHPRGKKLLEWKKRNGIRRDEPSSFLQNACRVGKKEGLYNPSSLVLGRRLEFHPGFEEGTASGRRGEGKLARSRRDSRSRGA